MLAVAVVLALTIAGCGDDDAPTAESPAALTVMTWNVYVGAEVQNVLRVTNDEELAEVASGLVISLETTDFRDRADALAGAIVAHSPDLVALQEVALWRTQEPSDPLSESKDVLVDFLTVLLEAVSTRGGDYEAVAVSTNVDAEVGTGDRDVRLTDRDVILARSDRVEPWQITGSASTFETNLSLESPLGGDFTVERGWAAADLRIDGAPVRVFSTHLEVPPFNGIQAAQAEELIEEIEQADGLVVLAGDFNSPAEDALTPTYGLLRDAGLVDAWQALELPAGPTCCHQDGLRGPSQLDARIDLVLVSPTATTVSAERVGASPEERSPAGRWPSDHAGVVATIAIGGG